jgi:hypothetical protein
MKCRQCGNPIRVNFHGHCSSSCLEYKPPIKHERKFEIVDASVDADTLAPLLRSKLINDFKALRGAE